jgi:hypothetical protein
VWWSIDLEGEKLRFDERKAANIYKKSLKFLKSITLEHIGELMTTSKVEQKFGLKVDKCHLWTTLVYISTECGG